MRTLIGISSLTILWLATLPASGGASEWKGTIKLGGVILDDEGDQSAMQESFNIYDGFTISRILVNGSINPENQLYLNLLDINQDSRKGRFDFRRPGHGRISVTYDQDRYVYDPDAAVSTERRDWFAEGSFNPSNTFRLFLSYNNQNREGGRLGYPTRTAGVLGDRVDYTLQTGRVEGELKKDRAMLALAYDFVDYQDHLLESTDRRGFMLSARAYLPGVKIEKLRHSARGAYGEHRLRESDLENKVYYLQYTGDLGPFWNFDLKYNFFGRRVDDGSTGLKTDNFRNSFDLSWRYRYGDLSGGYGYETNDDERSLTHYNLWRASGVFRHPKGLLAKIRYTSSRKDDEGKNTLLRDIDFATFDAKLELKAASHILVGGRYQDRDREYPNIGVEANGMIASGYLNYDYRFGKEYAGNLRADYSYSDDDYDDLVGTFHVTNSIFTGKLDVSLPIDLYLAGGVTWVDVGKDLDIEKSIVFLEASYSFLEDYRLEVTYNAFNYDDFVLVNRYYTANIVRIDIAYDYGLGGE